MTQAHAMQPLASGLADPVFGSQIVFRNVLDALSAPGKIFTLSDSLAGTPANLPPAAAALLLTLADYETTVWLQSEDQETRRWLSFHTGAPKASNPSDAHFAVIDSIAPNERLGDFNIGEDRYPDTSTTVLIVCNALEGGLPVTLTGPGIKRSTRFAPRGPTASLWRDIADNKAMYPLGVDLIFVAGSQLAGLPRSTRIEGAF